MSAILRFEVGQIPYRPLTMTINDEDTGTPINLAGYQFIAVEMLDPDGDEVDVSGLTLDRSGANQGILVLQWPSTRSLFDKRGKYYLRLYFGGAGKADYSDTVEIRVSEFGRVRV